ncbi:hypothetical protein, partial [Methanocalculus natronophilus]|uniref:hypothetical protein n=1 Tax=Methanocalculus natronophilus TaxID=1262400 RepID=UPI0031B634B9
MNTNYTFIHAEKSLKPYIQIFEGFFPASKVTYFNHKTCLITYPLIEEGESPEHLYELLLSDLNMRFSVVNIPQVAVHLLSNDFFKKHITNVSFKYYDYETFLLSVIKQRKEEQALVKKAFASTLNQSHIQNALAFAFSNMNVSIAAKNQYVHRNTLLYRIE